MATHQIALSYASEQEDYVTEVYEYLVKAGYRVFFAPKTRLWGVNMMDKFKKVFADESCVIVAFLSKEYLTKQYAIYEYQHAATRYLKNVDTILPCRFDDTDDPLLPSSVGYVDLRKTTPVELGQKIIEVVAELGIFPEGVNHEKTRTTMNDEVTIAELSDTSFGSVKRISARVILGESNDKDVIRVKLVKAVEKLQDKDISFLTKARTKATADVVMVFGHPFPDDMDHNNWICRALWNSPTIDNKYKLTPLSTDPEQYGDIWLNWNSGYSGVRQYLKQNETGEGDYLKHIDALFETAKALKDNGELLYRELTTNSIALEEFEEQAKLLADKCGEMMDKHNSVGIAPHIFNEMDKAFDRFINDVQNVYVPFARWFKGKDDIREKIKIMSWGFADTKKSEPPFLHERQKVRENR